MCECLKLFSTSYYQYTGKVYIYTSSGLFIYAKLYSCCNSLREINSDVNGDQGLRQEMIYLSALTATQASANTNK